MGLFAGAAVTSCGGFPNREGAATAVAAAVRALPGVTDTDVTYQNDFTGGAGFYLQVTLADNATPSQAADAGRTFVDRVQAADFARYDVQLRVKYRNVDDLMIRAPRGAHARIRYRFDDNATVSPSATEVADSLRRWLTIAQYPIVSAVRLNRPPSEVRTSEVQSFAVALRPAADERSVTALVDAQPELRQATWEIVAGTDTAPQIYTVRGQVPDQPRRRQWQRIVDTLGAGGSAEARTDTVDLRDGVAPTQVRITVASQAENPSDLVRAVAAQLPPLGLPLSATFVVDRELLTVTLGGCDPADQSQPPTALQTELRQRYQRC